MRLIKLFGVLLATIVIYLVLLHFKVSFGIALIAAMAFMWFGVKHVRQQHPETEESQNHYPEDSTHAEKSDNETIADE